MDELELLIEMRLIDLDSFLKVPHLEDWEKSDIYSRISELNRIKEWLNGRIEKTNNGENNSFSRDFRGG